MEITIDISSIDDVYEKYNKNEVSKELINYIIEKCYNEKNIKIVINNKLDIKITPLIYKGLENEYNRIYLKYKKNNIIQIIYLILGIIILGISSIISENVISEVILVTGWVFIWSVVELEIFTDTTGRKKRKIIKKILKSEIIEVL
ncbi:MAG: hypothetical protein IJZ36_01435 [Bacilli bacterium]|nr:hypothetical protein [Bacilli bacterium]